MGQTPSTRCKNKKIRMVKAVRNGDLDLLRKTLSKNNVSINRVRDHRGCPLLCLAVRKGDLDMVSLLLEKGGQAQEVKVNHESDDRTNWGVSIGQNPEHIVLTKLYINLEPDLEPTTTGDYVVCDRCGGKTVHRDDSVVDVDITDKKGLSPVHITAISGATHIAKVLIERGADVNKPDSLEASPLHAAAAYAHEEMCELLLDNGALANACEKSGLTPLHLAIMTGGVSVVRILLQCGSWPYVPDHEGRSPVHFAAVLSAFRGLDDVVRTNRSLILNLLLLKHGGNITYQDDSKCSPLSYALIKGNHRLVRMYLDYGMMLEKSDHRRMLEKHENHLSQYEQELDFADTKVPSLYRICRRTVMTTLADNSRHITDSHLIKAIDTLELPTVVKQFLSYQF